MSGTIEYREAHDAVELEQATSVSVLAYFLVFSSGGRLGPCYAMRLWSKIGVGNSGARQQARQGPALVGKHDWIE